MQNNVTEYVFRKNKKSFEIGFWALIHSNPVLSFEGVRRQLILYSLK